MLMFSDAIFLCIWSLIYFSYHYVARSQKEKIERIRLESELKIKQLESEKSEIEYQRNLGNYYLMALLLQDGITMAVAQLVIYGKLKLVILKLPGVKKKIQ